MWYTIYVYKRHEGIRCTLFSFHNVLRMWYTGKKVQVVLKIWKMKFFLDKNNTFL